MTVLVAGGTGFIGRAVVRALRHEGHEVRVLTSGGSTAPTRSCTTAASRS